MQFPLFHNLFIALQTVSNTPAQMVMVQHMRDLHSTSLLPLKGAILACLQSIHYAANCFQHTHSHGNK